MATSEATRSLRSNVGLLCDLEDAAAALEEGLRLRSQHTSRATPILSHVTLARFAVARGRLEVAVQVCAAVKRQLKSLSISLPPQERVAIDDTITHGRRVLGDARFDEEWERGQVLNTHELMALFSDTATS